MFTCENIESLVAIMAKEFNTNPMEIFQKVNAENPDLLPAKLKLKIFPKETKKTSQFATKVAVALAEEYKISAEEITNPSGKNGKILVSDIKAYYKAKNGGLKPLKPKKTEKVPEPVPEPEPEVEEPEAEAEELEENSDLEY